MSNPAPHSSAYSTAQHALSPLPPTSAPQTPGASSADEADTSDSDNEPSAPFTPYTPYTPGPDGTSVLSPSAAGSPSQHGSSSASGALGEFTGLKGAERKRPEGPLGKVELLLETLAEELNTLQTRAEAVYAPPREESGPIIHATVREVVDKLQKLDEAAPALQEWVPLQVLEYLDEGRNPDDYTRTMLELTAAENQFTNGKVHAVHSYLQHLSAGLAEAFPQMAEYVPPPSIPLSDLPDPGGDKLAGGVPAVVVDEVPEIGGVSEEASQPMGGDVFGGGGEVDVKVGVGNSPAPPA